MMSVLSFHAYQNQMEMLATWDFGMTMEHGHFCPKIRKSDGMDYLMKLATSSLLGLSQDKILTTKMALTPTNELRQVLGQILGHQKFC